MNGLEIHIKRVGDKLQLLLKNHVLLQKDNERQAKLIASLQSEKENDTEQIRKLQEQVNILKSVAGEMNKTDKAEFEKKINAYIREIDKCIGLLSE